MFPIVTKPIFKTAVWAGNKLSKYYGADYSVSEAWMLSVRPNDNSQAVNEPYAGKTLSEIEEYSSAAENFPLLIKLIDAGAPLSVQVHPDDEYAHKKGEPYGKTEMWYIVEAQPGAQLVYGLKKGADSATLEKAVKDGKTADMLNYVDARAGESYFIPAGMVHAIGAGILIAEIQQNSDTTYRLYDYDRVDKDGNRRQLHIEDAIACIMTDAVSTYECTAPVIAKCDFFTTEKHTLKGTNRFNEKEMLHILLLNGKGNIKYGGYTHPVEKYSSILAPAGCSEFTLEGDFEVLVTKA